MSLPQFVVFPYLLWTEWAWFVLGFTIPLCVAIVVAAYIVRSRL